jgi:uncharacterized phosphosugar-binding protein
MTQFISVLLSTGKGYSEEELLQYVPIVINNIVQNMKTLLKYSEELNPPCPISQANFVCLLLQSAFDDLSIHCFHLGFKPPTHILNFCEWPCLPGTQGSCG